MTLVDLVSLCYGAHSYEEQRRFSRSLQTRVSFLFVTPLFSAARISGIVRLGSGGGSHWPSHTLLVPSSESIDAIWPIRNILIDLSLRSTASGCCSSKLNGRDKIWPHTGILSANPRIDRIPCHQCIEIKQFYSAMPDLHPPILDSLLCRRVRGWRASFRVRWYNPLRGSRHFRSGPQSGSHGRVSRPLLINPDVRISRIRLSDEIMNSPTEGRVSSSQGR